MKTLLFLLTSCFLSTFSSAQKYDILIRNVRIIDGSGSPAFNGEIAISNNRIAEVSPSVKSRGKLEIDGRSRVVSPGFIDVHAHAEDIYTASMENYLRMGVTTILTGNCGFSEINIDSFLRQSRSTALLINMGTLIGHNSIREKVLGKENRKPTSEELIRMKHYVKSAMSQGAFGLSTGLYYVPGSFSQADEIIALASLASEYHGIYATHLRSEGAKIFDAIEEALQIGEEAKIPVQISHFKVAGKTMWGKSRETVEMVKKAREKGVQVAVDQYAYTASSTSLSSVIPAWALAGGIASLKKRTEDPDSLTKIATDMLMSLESSGRKDFSHALVSFYVPDTNLNGKSIPQITKETRGSDSIKYQIRQILEMVINADPITVFHTMDEEDVRYIMVQPFTMIAADRDPHKFGEGVPHPRVYGNNAKVLSDYVIDKRLFSLEEGIRKMTSLPATVFKIKDRGQIKKGFIADLLVFDPNQVEDLATFGKPHQYSVGIEYAIINGQIVLDNKILINSGSGKALRLNE